MPYHLDDTIAAVASAPGGGVRGIVRLSGPQAARVLDGWFVSEDPAVDLSALRRPSCLAGSIPLSGSTSGIPCDLYLWPTRRSYTRQPLAELHLPGSPPLLDIVMRDACARGARLAEPGEFTLRAFLAGRLDLAQAEAVLGVIDAIGGNQFEQALTQLAGGLSGQLVEMRGELLDLVAHLEAGLDFVEEEDVKFIDEEELHDQLAQKLNELESLREQMQHRSVAGDALRVALVGRPNAGKSSLFNALVAGQEALVSAQAGTTRDYLVARLELDGVPCELIDTPGSSRPFRSLEDAGPSSLARSASEGRPAAGLRDSSELCGDDQVSSGAPPSLALRASEESESSADEIDHLAQQLAWQQRRAAQLEIWCLDGTAEEPDSEAVLNTASPAWQAPRILVLTKSDQPRVLELPPKTGEIETSSLTGAGIETLRAQIAAALADQLPTGEWIPATASRCSESIEQAIAGLQRALAAEESQLGEDLIAAELRLTLDGLGTVVGATYTDDILDRIFSRFCIGK